MLTRVLFRWIPAALAGGFGIVTLLGFLVPDLALFRDLFATWAAVLAAFALLAGFLNVLAANLRRISTRQQNWPYSIALLLGVLVVIGTVLADVALSAAGPAGWSAARLDPGGSFTRWLFENVILQLELAVAALIVFFLAFAGWRALRRREGAAAASRPLWGTLLFLFAALVVLLRPIVILNDRALLDVQDAIIRFVDSSMLGGARGLLIGVAIGTIATGLRVLAGVDHPHSE